MTGPPAPARRIRAGAIDGRASSRSRARAAISACLNRRRGRGVPHARAATVAVPARSSAIGVSIGDQARSATASTVGPRASPVAGAHGGADDTALAGIGPVSATRWAGCTPGRPPYGAGRRRTGPLRPAGRTALHAPERHAPPSRARATITIEPVRYTAPAVDHDHILPEHHPARHDTRDPAGHGGNPILGRIPSTRHRSQWSTRPGQLPGRVSKGEPSMTKVAGHLKQNLVAYLALFVALGGTSYAALRIPAGSVGNRQLKNHSVTPVKLDGGKTAGYVADWAQITGGGLVTESRPRGARILGWNGTPNTPVIGGSIQWSNSDLERLRSDRVRRDRESRS